MYLAEVRIDGDNRQVFVAQAPTTPLLGTDLLWGFSLYVEFQPNGAVEIERLPESSS
jgi:hypothetical protein